MMQQRRLSGPTRVAMLAALFLTACSGGHQDTGAVTVDETDPLTGQPSDDESVGVIPLGAPGSPYFYTDGVAVLPPSPGSQPDAASADRDGDGLPDRMDVAPDLPATVALDEQRLGLVRAGIRVQGRLIDRVLHPDGEIELEIVGDALLDEHPHALLLGGDASRLAELVEVAPGRYQLREAGALQGIQAIAVATAAWQTQAMPMQVYASGSAWVVEPAAAQQDRVLALRGLNLRDASLWLADEPLPVLSAADDRLELRLPSDAVSGPVALKQNDRIVQQFPLQVQRAVTVQISPDWAARFGPLVYADERGMSTLDDRNPGRFWVATDAPQTIRLQVLEAASEKALLGRSLTIWPDEDTAHLNAQTVVLSQAWQGRRAWSLPALDWGDFRHELLMAMAADPTAERAVEQAVESGQAADSLIAVDAIRELARTTFSQEQPRKNVASPGISQGEALGQRVNYVTPDGSLGPNSEYALFSVGSVLDLCRTLGGRPRSFRPSDLCMVSSNELASSVAVRRGGKLLRNHIAVSRGIFGADIVGGTGGFFNLEFGSDQGAIAFKRPFAYLEASDATKTPLCGIEPCQVEIITGGFGVGQASPAMTPAEKRVFELLRKRALVDLIVLPVLSELSGALIDDNNIACVSNVAFEVFGGTQSLAEFYQKASGATKPDGSLDAEALAKEIRTYFTGLFVQLLKFRTLGSCYPSRPQDVIENLLDRAADEASQRLLSVITFAVNTSISAVQFATTPRKIVFKAEPVLEIAALRGQFDATAADSANTLEIQGSAIAEDQSPATAFYPSLRLGGRTGANAYAEVDVPLDASNYSGGVPAENRFLRLSGAALRSVIEVDGAFLPGTLDVSLVYTLENPENFDSAEVVIEVGEYEILGAPRVDGFAGGTSPATGGSRVFVVGYRLDALDLTGASVEYASSAQGEILRDLELIRYDEPDVPTTRQHEISFGVPQLSAGRSATEFDVTLVTAAGRIPLGSLLVVRPQVFGTATVSDSGACQDDQATVRLVTASGAYVTVDAANAPEVMAPVSGPDDEAASLLWNNSQLAADRRVAAVEVTCTDVGDDCRNDEANESAGVCTLGIVFDSDTSVPGSQTRFVSLRKDERRVFP
ncbi:MAG: hypothetical protein VX549_14620 [Pseudomonadota bacterium]|nr:hypothetical protein [Pseudomonadota bacterium]